jgi:hypothetical protein
MYLKQQNAAGTALSAVDLTGLTSGAVKFKMFNAATGAEAIAETATGVTFSADTTGLVNYTFQSPTFAAGFYNAFFVLTVAGKTDHFPVEPGEFRIEISDDTTKAVEAFDEATN